MPTEGDLIPLSRKIFNDKLSVCVFQEVCIESGDRECGAAELHPVGLGLNRMDASAEPIPVEEQAKAVIAVVANPFGVFAGGPIAGPPGLLRGGAGVKDNVNLLGLTYPAGNHSYAALKRTRWRVLKNGLRPRAEREECHKE